MTINLEKTYFFKVNNNHYVFDNNTSHLVPFSCEDYKVLRALSLGENTSHFSVESLSYVQALINTGMFVDKVSQNYQNINVYLNILKSQVSQLILVIAKDCNLRCKYCILGEHYNNNCSRYTSEKMNFKTAKKAIDYFIELNSKKMEHGFINTPTITFYGGEPLLNFELIEEVVDYCKSRKYSVNFGITTNGTLFTDKTISFLVDNNFSTTVSLDGNESETNRKRVFKNQIGAYSKIYKGAKKYIDYRNKNNPQSHLQFNACYDCGSNLESILDYFSNEFGNEFVLLNKIDPYNTNYYDQFSEKDYTNFNYITEKLKSKYLQCEENNSNENYFRHANLFGLYSIFKKRNQGNIPDKRVPCMPGGKICVDPEGKFYICEKMCYTLPIGDIINGLDSKKINKIIEDYIQIYTKNCKNCNVSQLCSMCFANTISSDGKSLAFNKVFCKEQKRYICDTIKNACSILENNPQAFDYNKGGNLY